MSRNFGRSLALARAQLGIPSLDAREPIGVGAYDIIRTPRPGAHTLPVSRPHPSLPAFAHPGGMVAPANAQRPQMNLSDRAEWAKVYMAIGIPVDSTEDAPAGILPGATLQIKAQSQVSVWITDFTIDSPEPCDFLVTQLKISRVDYIGGSGGIPATRFRQNSQRPQLNNEILSGGSFALVGVKNISKNQTLDFHGSFDGLDISKPMHASM